ncbi:RAQPRD family integrative conjugative element protein [Pseudomonas sp. B329]|uniref:integrative conjugative element protein, RAQPRD family n=1 Tax=Pseudomonas sp. B329 TaxID=1553459 RepID=UPI0032B6FFC2
MNPEPIAMPTIHIPRPLISILFVSSSCVSAAPSHEQIAMAQIKNQFEIIERLANRASLTTTPDAQERYRFDYHQFIQDTQRIRRGVESYLSPSRAQPRDASELVGDYRLDTPPAEPLP